MTCQGRVVTETCGFGADSAPCPILIVFLVSKQADTCKSSLGCPDQLVSAVSKTQWLQLGTCGSVSEPFLYSLHPRKGRQLIIYKVTWREILKNPLVSFCNFGK